MNVTSMNCTLELTLNCSKTMKDEPHKESKLIQDEMPLMRCTEGRIPVVIPKTVVECKKIPTYYCDSIWEMLDNGTKVNLEFDLGSWYRDSSNRTVFGTKKKQS